MLNKIEQHRTSIKIIKRFSGKNGRRYRRFGASQEVDQDHAQISRPKSLEGVGCAANRKFQVGWHMGLSENVGYIPNYSHLIGIMIINHWV